MEEAGGAVMLKHNSAAVVNHHQIFYSYISIAF